MPITMAMLVMAAAATPGLVDGTRLTPGDTCYAIVVNHKPVGSTWQTIHPSEEGGRPSWDIVVHQRYDNGSFDMRDHFILDRATLRPLVMESDRGKDRTDKAWQRIRLKYTAAGVMGSKETAASVTPIKVAFKQPVWDGNLWGLTFAALPLREGAVFTLPTWQYDKGLGQFTVRVVGKHVVQGPNGEVSAWDVLAGDNSAQQLHYDIAIAPVMELGYAAGPFTQHLGSNCSSD